MVADRARAAHAVHPKVAPAGTARDVAVAKANRTCRCVTCISVCRHQWAFWRSGQPKCLRGLPEAVGLITLSVL